MSNWKGKLFIDCVTSFRFSFVVNFSQKNSRTSTSASRGEGGSYKSSLSSALGLEAMVMLFSVVTIVSLLSLSLEADQRKWFDSSRHFSSGNSSSSKSTYCTNLGPVPSSSYPPTFVKIASHFLMEFYVVIFDATWLPFVWSTFDYVTVCASTNWQR